MVKPMVPPPRLAMRLTDKARGGGIPAVFGGEATPSAVMQCRLNTAGFSLRVTSVECLS